MNKKEHMERCFNDVQSKSEKVVVYQEKVLFFIKRREGQKYYKSIVILLYL